MSYFDDASLVMIPSGYKDQKVYSVKPIDGSGDLTFSRGSDIEATRVASNGYIQKAAVNLLTYSNTFSNAAWVKTSGTSVLGGQTGYDGGSDAWSIISDGTSGFAPITQNISFSGVTTFSIRAKAGTNSILTLRSLGALDVRAFFDLSTGTMTSTSNSIVTNIKSLGGGWYECSMSLNTANTSIVIYPNQLATPSAGNILIQDTQLNYGLVAQEYQETTTTSVITGITNDMPRLDYSGGASCPSLLLEPSRSNFVLRSEYIDSYTKFGSSVTQNSTTSPEGVENASTFVGNGSQIQIFLSTPITLGSGGSTTISAFAKADSNDFFELGFDGMSTSTTNVGVYNLSAGTATGTGADIEDYGNGWYRCILTQTIDAGDLTGAVAMRVRQEGSFLWPSAAAANGKSVFVYGIQCESGSYPTSYIPTYGTSATRLYDRAYKTGIGSLFGTNAGTIYFETTYYPESNTGSGERWVYAQGATSADYIRLWQDVTGGSKRIRVLVGTGGVQQVNISAVATELGLSDTEPRTIKFAFAYADNDFRMYVNGNKREDTAGTAPTITEINFNNTFATKMPLAQSLVFPTALSDSDLATLTA